MIFFVGVDNMIATRFFTQRLSQGPSRKALSWRGKGSEVVWVSCEDPYMGERNNAERGFKDMRVLTIFFLGRVQP